MTEKIQLFLLVSILAIIVVKELTSYNSQRQAKAIIVDSCGLIDGRVVELVNNSFITELIVVPQFILDELQLLADGRDSHKRERARFGLEVANELQNTSKVKVVIDRAKLAKNQTADSGLISLAQKRRAKIYTTDYNLNKRATVEGITVLNVNEIAQALRPVALPGEQVKVKIVQRGENRNQGVGYLEDGTMVVIEGASRSKGKVVEAMVTRSLQTAAGKMVFAKQQRSMSSGRE